LPLCHRVDAAVPTCHRHQCFHLSARDSPTPLQTRSLFCPLPATIVPPASTTPHRQFPLRRRSSPDVDLSAHFLNHRSPSLCCKERRNRELKKRE
jgi:hypothetical protein